MKTGIRMLGLCGLWAASCAWGGGCPQVETPERLWFDIPAQTLQRDLPVGSVVWQGARQVQQPASLAPCDSVSDARLNLLGSDSGLKSGASPVYGTSVNGLGYALSTDGGFKEGWPADGIIAAGKQQVSLRLVVIGPLSSGVLTAETLARRTLNGRPVLDIALQKPAAITRLACELQGNRNRTVALGEVARSDFRGQGSTRGERPFQLDLACDAGAQVNIQFDGVAVGSGAPGVLALVNPDASTSARGVGVQLLYRGIPLALGERLALEAAPQGLRSYPFGARYYQTQPQIAAGDANAVATFSLTYQ
ncbi:fimbrial protein [Serratia ficaria]|uniref:Type-1A pilin n=1 Tax=Serratia ficaria TaxID=61651 RepID=A0A240CAE3_SERFI|nr:fimbrial protein [Serratia ficaria]REF43186.1 type 1 fimbria pilin [Serratia ficaria]CAI0788794.1 Type-1A pilin [Serratia ficaria]CAI0881979.1 Type-1A pilin [Serratia ficaria]CAI1050489.1 Type-1A pilin [Serratia ficaria]CAI1075692.1 Type-1A pilin [Serratia ficaria]